LLLAHATEFYKKFFGEYERSSISLGFDFPHTLNDLDNWDLSKEFELEEIKGIACSLAHNKSPGPDGFPGEFCQFFWEQIKKPLKNLFDAFISGSLDIGTLNFGIITLLPKCEDALTIQKFRPICLMNERLRKSSLKGVNDRLSLIDDDIIDKTQTAFMKNRFIMEGVVVLHEVLHEVKKKNAWCPFQSRL
jgi:hypothetical protein